MQKTITVDGKKIKIQAKPRFYMGNLNGYRVKINNENYNIFTLHAQEAMDIAFSRYVQSQKV